MKKLLSLILIILCLVVAGCGEPDLSIIKTKSNLWKLDENSTESSDLIVASACYVDMANIFEMELNGEKVYLVVGCWTGGMYDVTTNNITKDNIMRLYLLDLKGKHILIDNYADIDFYSEKTIKEYPIEKRIQDKNWEKNSDDSIEAKLEKFIKSSNGKKAIREGFKIK